MPPCDSSGVRGSFLVIFLLGGALVACGGPAPRGPFVVRIVIHSLLVRANVIASESDLSTIE